MNDQRITARELRIGNYVNRINFGECFIVAIKDTEVRTSRGTLPIRAIEGIPLTDEWLKRSDMSTGDVFWGNFSQDSQGFFLWISGYKVYLKFVHQMQNAYFALTGTELTIKETAS